ncbi:MAG: sigma-70 family RNA polymerase sigma factor, partial [Acidobacteria bacterium]|nr:sigma-70 family RNA polymerase sigma factor [Acidobacteriota bacterium]
MPTHLENETGLVAEARSGSAEAFTILVRQYDRNIYRLALNITHNKEDAEDVLQETFLKAYANLGTFQGNSRFYTWLVRIAINEALMKLRKRRTNKSVSLDEPLESDDHLILREIVDWGETPEERCSRSELQQILSDALASLEPDSRTVVVL